MDFNTSYNALLRDNKPHVAPSAYEARRDYRTWVRPQYLP